MHELHDRIVRFGRTLMVVLVASTLFAPVVARAVQPVSPNVAVTWGVEIPLRDGVKLNATVYKPADMTDPLPVSFTLTPYTADTYHERGWYFAQHGYVFVLVDVRGRGNSEGEFEPFFQEANDGYDVVEWLAKQPWCDGKVTMWGGSYAGYDQWAVATEFPPHLATIVPAAAAFPGWDFPMERNIPGQYDIQWATLTSGVTANFRLFGQDEYWTDVFWTMYEKHLPFEDLPELAGNTTTKIADWIAHPMQDAYWDAGVPSDGEFAKIDIPILTITGAYDGDQPGALHFYSEHMLNASADARAKHYLIIGPWNHAGTRTPRKEVGGLTFGDASMLDLNDLHRQWYDWTMKDGPKPESLKKRVAYFVVGANEWKYADSLDTIATGHRRLYLTSTDGRANDAFHSGSLLEKKPAKGEAPDHWVNDPLDTRPGAAQRTDIPNYLTDQRFALELYDAGVIYHSEPFAEDTEVTGSPELDVWIAIDVPDTDFEATLYEILPDGGSVMLSYDAIRARYRESSRAEKLVKPGEINLYRFDRFRFFSRKIHKGSRLRLVLKSINSIYSEKNYQSGGVVAKESGKDARTAHVTVLHDAEHPSALVVPVVE